LENVKGLLSHDGGNTYIKIHKLLKSAGYFVRVVLLNSRFYGSAQARERIIFLGSREDFIKKPLGKTDESKVFKDIRDMVADENFSKEEFEQLRDYDLEMIGDYDRVGTLTTGDGCGNKKVACGEQFRNLSVLECERLQGFPEGWTKGVSDKFRYWALGNAVNCNVSRYLFTNYLKGLWY
jgi:DNA (cytosine-5)-methyltransferase 1